jgi:IS5 family transposase
MLADLLHGNEKKVWGDAGYQGQTETIQAAAPQAQNMTTRRVKTRAGVDQEQKNKNRTKSRVRAKVEWPFRILKRVFKYTKVRYRGIRKNHEWLLTAFALVNLYQHRKQLVPQAAWCVRRPATASRRTKTALTNRSLRRFSALRINSAH